MAQAGPLGVAVSFHPVHKAAEALPGSVDGRRLAGADQIGAQPLQVGGAAGRWLACLCRATQMHTLKAWRVPGFCVWGDVESLFSGM